MTAKARRRLFLASLLLIAPLLALLAPGCSGRDAPAPTEAPSGRVAATSQAPAPHAPGFVGSKRCVDCHAKFYELWSTSHHGKAMQVFGPKLAATLAPMAEPIAVGDRRYRADIRPEGSAVVESGPDGERRLPILHALGGKNAYYFLTELERGKLQVLPVAYDVHARTWYDTAASGMRHFERVRDDVHEQPVRWTDREYTFNTACHGCHVSQVATHYDLANDSYRTTWTEPGINCETCHGPAEAHVAAMEGRDETKAVGDPMLVPLGKKNSVAQNNAVCASCHAKSYLVAGSFQPGDDFFDHYGLVALEHPDFYPDGRDLGENYTLTSWLMSPCAAGGELSCLHCHTSSGRSRFTPETANNACLPCHSALVADSAAHSRHAAGTAADRCTACHMPTTRFAAMNRSDHSMRPPAPAATIAFQSPNACNLCHTDKDAAWADGHVRAWFPRDYQKPIVDRGRLVEAARRRDPARLPDILAYLAGPNRDPVTTTSLLRLLADVADPRVAPAAATLLADPSPLVRSAAVEALGARIDAARLPKLAGALRDPSRLVRTRAASVLAAVPPTMLPEASRPALDAALAEYAAALDGRPDDPSAHANRASLAMARGDVGGAVAAFDAALRLDPRNYPVLVSASVTYSAAGRTDRAEQCLRQAVAAEPKAAAAHFNLGLLLAETGRPDLAEKSLRDALAADPRMAQAGYNLALLVGETRPDEAIALLRKAAADAPDEPRFASTLALFLARRGFDAEAVGVLEKLLAAAPDQIEAYFLLASIHERAGRAAEAVSAYRRAAARPELDRTQRAIVELKLRGAGPPVR